MGLWSTVGSIAGGAIGTVLLPGIGTGIGASLGGALGGAADSSGSSGGEVGARYMDPYAAQQNAVAQSLLQSHQGADAASSVTRRVLNRAQLNRAQDENNPLVQSNASVRNALSNARTGEAYDAASDAAVKGAGVDLEAKERGANILAGQQKFDYGAWSARHNELMQPSALETIGTKALGTFAGTLAEKGGNAVANALGGGNGDSTDPADTGTDPGVVEGSVKMGAFNPRRPLWSGDDSRVPSPLGAFGDYSSTPTI